MGSDENDVTFRNRPGFWNKLKARWYRRGLEGSTFPRVVAPYILTHAAGAKTFLDVGAGCGSLAIPLAEAGKDVTALDPSAAMIAILEEEKKRRGLANIKTVIGPWKVEAVEPADVIICANVPGLLKGSTGFIKEALTKARKYIFLIEGAGPTADKFYYKELYPLIFNRTFGPRKDYLATYTALHEMGIYANVRIVEYDFDQPFDSLDEAVEFWKEHMCIVTAEHDEALRGFLEKKLEKTKTGLVSRIHKRSAIIWWKTEGAEK